MGHCNRKLINKCKILHATQVILLVRTCWIHLDVFGSILNLWYSFEITITKHMNLDFKMLQ